MFGVCIRYDGNEDCYDHWQGVLLSLGCSNLYVRGGTDVCDQYKIKPVHIETADDLPSDCELVVVSPIDAREVQGKINLTNFTHPEKAIYFFGCDFTHENVTGTNNVMTKEDDLGSRRPDHYVYIDTQQDLYSFGAGGITLYDRRVKE